MRCLSLVSPLGGVGRTTLAAHCATLLAASGTPVLAFDLSPQNTLGLHLGLSAPPEQGWQAAVRDGRWLGETALENSAGVRLLPHGALAHRTSQPQGWLAGQLTLLDLPADGVAVLDTPALPAPMAEQALLCADLVVLVLDVSPRAVHAHAALQSWIDRLQPTQRWAVVLNGMDPRSAIRRSTSARLRAQWGERLLPYALHQDEHVPQAQEQALCVHQSVPQAQAAHDLQGIAAWVSKALGLSLTGTQEAR